MDKLIKKFRSNSFQGAFDKNDDNVETTYSIDELVEVLRGNKKVEYVKVCVKESFDDEDEVESIWIVVTTQMPKHNEFVRSLRVTEIEDDMYNVRIQLKKNPLDTLIKDIYTKCIVKGHEWGTGKTPTDNVTFTLRVNAETLLKLVNWKYSVVNR